MLNMKIREAHRVVFVYVHFKIDLSACHCSDPKLDIVLEGSYFMKNEIGS